MLGRGHPRGGRAPVHAGVRGPGGVSISVGVALPQPVARAVGAAPPRRSRDLPRPRRGHGVRHGHDRRAGRPRRGHARPGGEAADGRRRALRTRVGPGRTARLRADHDRRPALRRPGRGLLGRGGGGRRPALPRRRPAGQDAAGAGLPARAGRPAGAGQAVRALPARARRRDRAGPRVGAAARTEAGASDRDAGRRDHRPRRDLPVRAHDGGEAAREAVRRAPVPEADAAGPGGDRGTAGARPGLPHRRLRPAARQAEDLRPTGRALGTGAQRVQALPRRGPRPADARRDHGAGPPTGAGLLPVGTVRSWSSGAWGAVA